MNRNNTVSVIEVAATDDPNSPTSSSQSNLPSGSENFPLSLPVGLNLPVTTAEESSKLLIADDTSQVVLIDKIAFRLKMKEILICEICTEIRRCPIYQCKQGHLICAGCFNDILAESRQQNEIAACPNSNCQTTITKDLCFRNIAVEKTISELPVCCPYCSAEFPPDNFKYHQTIFCKNRPSVCTNSIIGCPWKGPYCDKATHEENCKQPSATGYEILKSLATVDQKQKEGMELYTKLMDLLSVEKISYTDLQLKQFKTENDTVLFETSKFSAFENQWSVRVSCVTDASKNINLSYQLISKSKLLRPMNIQYMILRGPYNEMDIRVKIYEFKFGDKLMETPFQVLDVPKVSEREVFETAKRINIRVLLFVVR